MATLPRSMYLALLIISALFFPSVAEDTTSYTPDRENFQEWLSFIRPNEQESRFERVGWRNQFWPAVEEARRLGRPILLWTMNGHPLGCT